jgi:coenzyme PQQ precursor peptide PqqA
MSWKAPKIVELPVGMEINMYACAVRSAPALPKRP